MDSVNPIARDKIKLPVERNQMTGDNNGETVDIIRINDAKENLRKKLPSYV